MSGTVSVIILPSMAAIVRSVIKNLPALIQVWAFPSRTKLSIFINLIHFSVTGLRISILSPTESLETLSTVSLYAPAGIYLSITLMQASPEDISPIRFPTRW